MNKNKSFKEWCYEHLSEGVRDNFIKSAYDIVDSAANTTNDPQLTATNLQGAIQFLQRAVKEMQQQGLQTSQTVGMRGGGKIGSPTLDGTLGMIARIENMIKSGKFRDISRMSLDLHRLWQGAIQEI